MSDIELWSIPWHELQRSVAETFRSDASANATAKQKTARSQIPDVPSSNWLVRARGGTAYSHQPAR